MTITEYGNSVPYTGKLDDLSEQPVKEIVQKVLKNDAKKAFDIGAWEQFNARARCASRPPPATRPTRGADHERHLHHDQQRGHGQGPREGDRRHDEGAEHPAPHRRRLRVPEPPDHVPPVQERPRGRPPVHGPRLPDDPERRNRPLREHPVRRADEHPQGWRGGLADLRPEHGHQRPWNNAKSSWAFFMGDDTVAEGIAVPEEMRGKIPSDFGRDKGIAWYYVGGFGLVHTRDDASGSRNARIVKWDSGQ
jgi:hypothetical protein